MVGWLLVTIVECVLGEMERVDLTFSKERGRTCP